jgi:hypothetical protein
MKQGVRVGIFLTAFFLIVHTSILSDYGLTWDFHHHFFAGLHHMGIPLSPKFTDHIPFTVPDPRGTYDLPFGPIMLITPVTTYLLFYEKLHLLPFDNSYHIGIVIVAMLGLLSLFIFLLEAEGLTTAIFGFIFLALLPRYFGDLHNNMKDVPQAAAFALAVWTYWRLLNYRHPKDLIFALLAFAVAFNMKLNTLFVPPIALCWTGVVLLTSRKRYLRHPITRIKRKDIVIVGVYFLLCPIAAFALWMPFWKDPIERLVYLFRFFQDNTTNLEVLYFGTIYRSTINVPWYYPYGYIAVTTPVVTLVCALIGFLVLCKRFFTKNPTSILYILWFFIPLSRYMDSKIGVIDGIRHFEEVVYPLCAVAGIGAAGILGRWQAIVSRKYVRLVPSFALVLYLSITVIRYHPFQIAYFSEMVGGIRGALGKFDIDYWGTSQKPAIMWLNAHAKKGSFVHIVMAPEAASIYLRPDLLEKVNTKEYENADYVVILNRQSFYYRYTSIPGYIQARTPAYEVLLQGVPLTMVFDNSLPSSPFPHPWWLHPAFAPVTQ